MEIEARVLSIVSGVLQCSDVSTASGKDVTPEWDSLKHAEIMIAAEDAFALEFSLDELDQIHSVADLVRIVDIHLGQARD